MSVCRPRNAEQQLTDFTPSPEQMRIDLIDRDSIGSDRSIAA